MYNKIDLNDLNTHYFSRDVLRAGSRMRSLISIISEARNSLRFNLSDGSSRQNGAKQLKTPLLRLRQYALIVLLSLAIMDTSLVLAPQAFAQANVQSVTTSVIVTSTNTNGIFLHGELRLSYTDGIWFGLYTYDMTNGYAVVLDHNEGQAGSLLIMDSGNVITMTSKVLTSQMAGISAGDLISCKIDFNTSYERCDNLTKGTFASGAIAGNFVIRNEIPNADTTAPTVSIQLPGIGPWLRGSAAPIDVAAKDNVGVSKVMMYVDSEAPNCVSIVPTAYGSGSHMIMALAIYRAYNYSIVGISVTLEKR